MLHKSSIQVDVVLGDVEMPFATEQLLHAAQTFLVIERIDPCNDNAAEQTRE